MSVFSCCMLRILAIHCTRRIRSLTWERKNVMKRERGDYGDDSETN